MFNFEYYAPTRVIFGRGVEERTGALLRELGISRVLIHYGGGSAVKSGPVGRGWVFYTISGPREKAENRCPLFACEKK